MALVLLARIGGIRDSNEIRMHGAKRFTIITRQIEQRIARRSL
jgi:hypothetical protein